MINLKLFLVSFITFLFLDAIWLGLIARGFYSKHLSLYLTDNVIWPSAFIFYIIFNIGLLIFVILPSIEKNSYSTLLIYSILYGLVTFATYDLTNHATIKDWPLIVSIVDMSYGMFVALVSSSAAFYANKYLM
ncbi:MAG: DUF2177 family protein [Gammaproteobacteria bacterium]|jgi:uncharacterized membrane protein|nr:DUF2177 family protein [Gammaproteobacteria bacterium]MBT7523209.1 DUF2177 family protein [Gammaproteobacteria bacterium]|tara:strand:- start:348 stop:746 length:399 start_codon:yes stop_codon:yes gene_type:complete